MVGVFQKKGCGEALYQGLVCVTGSSEMEFFKAAQTLMLKSVLCKADQAAAFVPWEGAGPKVLLRVALSCRQPEHKQHFKGCCQGFLKSL